SVTTDYGTPIAEPAVPTRTGHMFAGWYADAALQTPWNFATDQVTAHRSLYAKWEVDRVTVSFEVNEGSAVPSVTTDYGTAIAEPTAPTKTGHTIADGYAQATLQTPRNFATDQVTS